MIYPPLCHNENYAVFACKLLFNLISVCASAKQALLGMVENITKVLKPNENVALWFFLANTCIQVGKEGYAMACKLYEVLLMNTVFYLSGLLIHL